MLIIAAVGGACFLLLCIVGGARLFLLSLRTRKFPEFALGAGLLLMGGIGTPMGAIARAPLGLSDELRAGLLATQFVILALGMAGFARFTYQVFRPHAAWAKWLAWLLPLGMLSADLSVGLFEGGFLQVIDGYLGGYLVQQILMLATLTWTGVESLVCSAAMRRRQKLGLVEAVVVDRVRLWGIAMVLASLMTGATVVGQIIQVDLMASAAGTAFIACTGFVAACAIYLAFLPPRAYTSWVAARNAEAIGAQSL